MKWKVFEESKTELPEVMVETMAEGFSSATKDLLILAVAPKSDITRLSKDTLGTKFQFKTSLLSNTLRDYSFTVFEFGYNVNLYPVFVRISKSILEDLISRGERVSTLMTFESEDAFREAVELIFNSDEFAEVVSGLMKISSQKKTDFPF